MVGLSSCGGEAGTRKAAASLPIRDDFEGDCTWPEETTDNDEVGCSDGQYRVVIKRASRSSFIPRRTQDGHRAVSVGAKTMVAGGLEGDNLALQGVGCWASGRGEPALGYVFALGALGDGSRGYVIGRQNEDDPELQQNPLRMEALVDEQSASLPPLGEAAELRGECRKEGDAVKLALYVDGTKVAEATDTQDAPDINVFVAYGFFAFASKAETDFRYDDFVAEELSSSPGTSSETSTQAASETSPLRVVYRETFAHKSSDWPSHASHAAYDTGYADGRFRIELKKPNNALQLPQLLSGTDQLDVQADVRKSPPNPGDQLAEEAVGCGLGSSEGYLFIVVPDQGSVSIRRQHEESEDEIVADLVRDTVKKPTRANHLRALCQVGENGSTVLDFWVNGRHVLHGEDGDGLSSFDRFSIAATNGARPTVTLFDNLLVRSSE